MRDTRSMRNMRRRRGCDQSPIFLCIQEIRPPPFGVLHNIYATISLEMTVGLSTDDSTSLARPVFAPRVTTTATSTSDASTSGASTCSSCLHPHRPHRSHHHHPLNLPRSAGRPYNPLSPQTSSSKDPHPYTLRMTVAFDDALAAARAAAADAAANAADAATNDGTGRGEPKEGRGCSHPQQGTILAELGHLLESRPKSKAMLEYIVEQRRHTPIVSSPTLRSNASNNSNNRNKSNDGAAPRRGYSGEWVVPDYHRVRCETDEDSRWRVRPRTQPGTFTTDGRTVADAIAAIDAIAAAAEEMRKERPDPYPPPPPSQPPPPVVSRDPSLPRNRLTGWSPYSFFLCGGRCRCLVDQ